MKRKYYFSFSPAADVNYLFLFSLWDIAEYNQETKRFDTVRYTNLTELAARLNVSAATLSRYLSGTSYNAFFTLDRKNKAITLLNDVKELKPFVMLTDKQVSFLKKQKDKLLCKYFVYLAYYCRLSATTGTAQDFTAKQFLSSIGYCATSNKNLDKVSGFNCLLVSNELIKITKFRDETGHTRNIYTLL